MSEKNYFSPKDARALRRWFKKIDENTLELKIKWKGLINIILISLALIPSLYYDFIKPRSSERFRSELMFSFMPETRFQKEWDFYGGTREDKDGRLKKQFMDEMWNMHKNDVWKGYWQIAWYLCLWGIIFWPSKKRVRFDRKRGVIYSYVNDNFYLMEINKLMRPFSESIINTGNGILFWLPPFNNKKNILKYFPFGSIMFVADYSMYLFELGTRVCGISNIYRKSKAPFLKKCLVDFMNPNIDPEWLAEIMNVIEAKKGLFERLNSFLFGWIDEGLCTRRLPTQEKLDAMIEKYFKEKAPKIRALPSYRRAYKEEENCGGGAPFLVIISQDENRKAGFIRVPCPNLFEYPEETMHKESICPDSDWGHIKGKEL